MTDIDFSWVKENPAIAAAAIGGGGLLLFLYIRARNASQDATAAVAGPSAGDYQLAAQNNQLTAQAASETRSLNAQLQLAGLNQTVALKQIEAATADSVAGRDNEAAKIAADLSVALSSIKANQATQEDANRASLAVAQLAANTQTQLADISARTAATLADIAASQSSHLADISSQTTMALARDQTNVALAQIAGTTSIAEINAAATTAVARLNSSVSIAQTQANADIAKTISKNNLTGGIIGTLARLF